MNGPYAHGGMRESYERHTEVLAAVRKALGPGHHADGRRAVSVGGCRDLPVGRQGLGASSTSISSRPRSGRTMCDENGKLAEAAPMRIAVRRMAGDPLRVRGADGRRARCRWRSRMSAASAASARRRSSATWRRRAGCTIVPHCWKTGISISATAHLAFAQPTAPSSNICRRSCASRRLRRSWPSRNWCWPTATIPLPTKPGLGVEVDWDALVATRSPEAMTQGLVLKGSASAMGRSRCSGRSTRGRQRRIPDHPRALGLGQDDHFAPGRRLHRRPPSGRILFERRGHHRAADQPAPLQHRVPGLCALSRT